MQRDKGWTRELQIQGSSGACGRLHPCLAVPSMTPCHCRPLLELGAGSRWAVSTIPVLRAQAGTSSPLRLVLCEDMPKHSKLCLEKLHT